MRTHRCTCANRPYKYPHMMQQIEYEKMIHTVTRIERGGTHGYSDLARLVYSRLLGSSEARVLTVTRVERRSIVYSRLLESSEARVLTVTRVERGSCTHGYSGRARRYSDAPWPPVAPPLCAARRAPPSFASSRPGSPATAAATRRGARACASARVPMMM